MIFVHWQVVRNSVDLASARVHVSQQRIPPADKRRRVSPLRQRTKVRV